MSSPPSMASPAASFQSSFSPLHSSPFTLSRSFRVAQFRRYHHHPLHIACETLNLSFVRLLVGIGCDVNERNHSEENCLHIVLKSESQEAGRDSRLELLTQLLEFGCDPNARDYVGCTPLWYAVR